MPDGQRLVLVLRVDADAVPHPVMVSGRVLFRIPGHSVPADRRRVLDLVARDQAARDTERGRMRVLRPPWHPTEMGIRPENLDPQPRTGALRVIGGFGASPNDPRSAMAGLGSPSGSSGRAQQQSLAAEPRLVTGYVGHR
jgi:hypothetical protein